MKSNTRSISQALLVFVFAVLAVSSVMAQAIPDSAPISDQKAGSVLIFNYYGSNAANPNGEDTEIHITNTNPQKAGTMALLFIDGKSGAVADNQVCLAPNQTVNFRMSNADPDIKGYIIAVSVDASTGLPNYFNQFIGSASSLLASGHTASLNAEAISALMQSPASSSSEQGATLKFDEVHYNKVPGMLALDNLPAIADGNQTMVLVNQIGGSLPGNRKMDNLGGLTGIVYDAAAKPYAWQVGNINTPQFQKVITADFPLTTPLINVVIPAQSSGWMRLWPTSRSQGVTGAVLFFDKSDAPGLGRCGACIRPLAAAGNGRGLSRNLHHQLLTTAELTIPVYPRKC
ncbi:MAG: hypothetical protein U0Y68_04495 [Blastocatellia bacterium]